MSGELPRAVAFDEPGHCSSHYSLMEPHLRQKAGKLLLQQAKTPGQRTLLRTILFKEPNSDGLQPNSNGLRVGQSSL